MTGLPAGEVLWSPPANVRSTTRIGAYLGWLERERGLHFDDYQALWQWSVTEIEDFWQTIWEYFEVRSSVPPGAVLGDRGMPGAQWFPGTRVNYAEHALRHDGDDEVVLVAHSQTRDAVEFTRAELRSEVARVRTGLQRLGVGPGDRVAGYLPNIPEAVIGFLAAASLGAIWAVCPPEFGINSVLDRLRQIDPKVLFAVDGYRYGAKEIDRVCEVEEIRGALTNVSATVTIPYLRPDRGSVPATISWQQLRAEAGPLEFADVRFDHPLWILFSSGTTGPPKPIVHGHGGTVLEQLKMGALLQDLGPGERYFFFSTTAWMIWNRSVSSLLTGASIAILDGDPMYPKLDALFEFVADNGVTNWGVSAAYLMRCADARIEAGALHDLSRVRQIVAAGSPVPVEGYRYVHRSVKPRVHFYSGSGGTDVCTGFVSGTPLSVVTAGEIPARLLGVKAEAYDEQGRSLIDEPGELVITEPMPSMPIAFWNDPSGERYRNTYFDTYPGVWRHGDRFIVSPRGTCAVLGRSDATLNRGGVRLGTSEFYSVVDTFAEVAESLVVHLDGSIGTSGDLLLYVQLADGYELDDGLCARLRHELGRQRSPRHVPDEIHAVPVIPTTLTGKKLEVPVKNLLMGLPVATVATIGSLQDPTSFEPFVAFAKARAESR
jgi:acetoacetyl-CoA synthetase